MSSEYKKMYMTAYVDCPCGKRYQRYSAWNHKNTSFHCQYVKYNGGWITAEEYYTARSLLLARKMNNRSVVDK